MKIQLSDFAYVNRPSKKKGLCLRFTLSKQVPLIDGNKWEESMEGCIAFYDFLNVLRWTAPINRWSPVKTQQLHWFNPIAYNYVLETLLGHPQSKKMLDNLVTPMQKLMEMTKEQKKVQNTDPELPKLIEREEI